MDKFDQLILQQLQQNARISVSELASLVHLSRSAVTARIKKLEQQGIIAGYQVLVGAAKKTAQNTAIAQGSAQDTAQDLVRAYLAVQHTAASCQQLVPLLQQIPEVKSCHGISGEIDLMLYLETSSVSRLHQIREQLDALPLVSQVRTHLVLSEWFNRQHTGPC